MSFTTMDRKAAMLSVLIPDRKEDADDLECRWGMRVALDMLREHVISPMDFFELCEEAASATEPASHPAFKPARYPSQVA